MKTATNKARTAKTDRISDVEAAARSILEGIIEEHKSAFITTDEGFVFGSAAYCISGDKCNFVTTARGKNEAAEFAYVKYVDHQDRKVCCSTSKKATLNAPLFDVIFNNLSEVQYILHFHHQRDDLVTMDYATPGTDKDSLRSMLDHPSFNIKGHGCILSFTKEGKLIR